MKLALLLPGYIESPNYRHLVVIDNKLTALDYTVLRVDPCNLWSTVDANNYTTTNYVKQVETLINSYQEASPTEIILVGHSLGSLVALLVGSKSNVVTKIICLSPPSPLGQSDHKWVNGFRVSKKDLPNNSSEFRIFSIPFSFVTDRNQYSVADSIKNNKKPLTIIIGDQDPSIVEIEELVNKLHLPNFTKIKNMGHDFRQSEDLCNRVANKIEVFLNYQSGNSRQFVQFE
jgi:pimeloyl-ACP methyl ester carboxylesterase